MYLFGLYKKAFKQQLTEKNI